MKGVGHAALANSGALIKSLMAKALQGNVRATAAMLALYARVATEHPDDGASSIAEDEIQILRRFAPRLVKKLRKEKSRS